MRRYRALDVVDADDYPRECAIHTTDATLVEPGKADCRRPRAYRRRYLEREEKNLALAEPLGPDGLPFTPRTTTTDLVQRFGAPTRVQELSGETILYYERDALYSQFQLDGKGQLTRWEVYLN